MAPASACFLIDANVLIDYRDSDISILTLATQHLGRVRVIETVLDEVDGLDSAWCERLGAMNAFIEAHDVRPVIGRVFGFEDAPAAFEFMRDGDYSGKIVIRH